MDPRVRPPGGLLDIMRENARKLGEIRKLCNKVALIRNMGQQPPGVRLYSISSNIRYINLQRHLRNSQISTSMPGVVSLRTKISLLCQR
jgi:hypothetical protein